MVKNHKLFMKCTYAVARCFTKLLPGIQKLKMPEPPLHAFCINLVVVHIVALGSRISFIGSSNLI